MTTEETTNPPLNKAQTEFAKYAQGRDQAAASANAGAAGGFPAGSLSWAVPIGGTLTYVAGPPASGRPSGASTSGGGRAEAGRLTEGVGTTLRLGVDLLNAMLSSSVKVLGGFTSAYGGGHCDDGGCGCGCGCESCCAPSCCQPSCCECDCCHSGVGACC